MKKIRLMSILMVLVLSCSLLTGCVGEIAEVKIEPNGSGIINMQFGFTDDALETMVALGTDPSEIERYKPFVYNGVTYYGETVSQSFNSVKEFNAIMNGNVGLETQNMNVGAFCLAQDEYGAFIFTLDTSNSNEEIGVNVSEYTEEEIAILTENMHILFTIVFPANILQVEGPKHGVTVNGNTLKLDFLELSENDLSQYVFITGEANDVVFTDVAESHWANRAIYSLTYGGLVSGVGNNQFAPDTSLTRAQFYQILARAVGLEVGEENDYWAYKAIKSCKDFGLIIKSVDMENFDKSEFDKPILREEAVAALTLATDYAERIDKGNVAINESSIPDFSDIDVDYQEYILMAYQFGITSGVNSNRTFNPHGQLTRAQGCQLFYNLNWCSIPR